MTHAVQSALIALGANLPQQGASPEITLRQALADLGAAGATVLRSSRLFRTPCFPAGAGPDGRVEPRSLGSGVRRDGHRDRVRGRDVAVNTVQSAKRNLVRVEEVVA